MIDYTAANLEALHKHQGAHWVTDLDASADSADLEILQTPSGHPTARHRGRYLHSRYDPMKEARRIVADEDAASCTAAVALGFGLGYLPQAFIERYPEKPLVIVEERPLRFRQALAVRDLRPLLAYPCATWCIGEQPETVVMKTERLPLRRLTFFRLAGTELPRRGGYYERIESLLASVLDKRTVNINTLRRFGELWVRNLLSNLNRFVTNPGIRVGENLFSSIPALVLAAGPSLEEVIPELEALRQRCLIVSVDTSYRFCRYGGIEPDFLVTVDPQYWNSRHLDWLERTGTVLVSESSAHPRIFRSADRAEEVIFYISSFFPLGSYIEELIGKRGQIGAGGSVATTAWDLCRYLGCSPIYMAGLDLGFPGKRTHARGAFFEESSHWRSSRFRSAEQLSFDYLLQARPITLRNNSGGWTLSDRRMMIYKSWFEDQIKQQSARGGPATFSLSAGGIAVEGMEHLPVLELRRLEPQRERIDTALVKLRKRGRRMIGEQRLERVVENMTGLVEELHQLQSLASRGSDLAGSGKPAGELIPALEELDRQILTLASRQIAGFLFQPLIHEILDNPGGGDDFSRILATSQNLYRNLEFSASYHRELMENFLKRL